MNYVCKGSTKTRNKRRKSEKFLKSFVVSYILFTFALDDESLKRLVAHRRVFFDAVYSRMWN